MDSYRTPPPAREPDQSPPSWWDDGFRRAIVLTVAGAAVLAATLFGVLQVVGRNHPPVAGGSVSPSAQASVEPSASETEGPSETASPSAAPSEGDPGLAAGWYQLTATLTLREAPSVTAGAILRGIPPDTVVRLSGDPTRADGYDWYEARNLDGYTGWMPSGTTGDEFVQLLTTDDRYEACGRVGPEGVRVAGLRIGQIDPSTLAVLRLSHAIGGSACVQYVEFDGYSTRILNVAATGCGRPVLGALRPTSAGDAPDYQRVTEPVRFTNAFFEEGANIVAGELYNRWTVLLIGRQNVIPLVCASGVIDETPVEGTRYFNTAVQGCMTVTQQSATEIWILPEAAASDYPLGVPASSSIDAVTVGEARMLAISATTRNNVEELAIANVGPCPA
jgi:hypothetical protein